MKTEDFKINTNLEVGDFSYQISNMNSNQCTAEATTDCESQKKQFRSQDWQKELKSNWLKVIKQTICDNYVPQ